MNFFRKKENLIIEIDITPKRKYDLDWQRGNIGNPLKEIALKYFKEVMVVYNRKKDKFVGFDLILLSSRFKLNKIEDNTKHDQFFYRYKEFLPSFMVLIDSVLSNLKFKFKFKKIQHLSSTKKEIMFHYAKEIGENEGGTINFNGDGTQENYSINIPKKKK